MLKVNIYIEKNDFDAFFKWVNRLHAGILVEKAVEYSTEMHGFEQPLVISLDPRTYHLLQDAESDAEEIKEIFGDFVTEYEPLSRSWEMRSLKDVLRNAKRYDLEIDVIYTALITIAEVPGLTPSEAMIIAEREWILHKEKRNNA